MFSKSPMKYLIYCDCEINNEKSVFLGIGDVKTVSLFGGCDLLEAISESAVSLQHREKASSAICLSKSVFVLRSIGQVLSYSFESGSNIVRFSPVSEFEGYEIV